MATLDDIATVAMPALPPTPLHPYVLYMGNLGHDTGRTVVLLLLQIEIPLLISLGAHPP